MKVEILIKGFFYHRFSIAIGVYKLNDESYNLLLNLALVKALLLIVIVIIESLNIWLK